MMDPAGRETLSVAITTRNVAHLLKGCLESVAWADEIIVVDMFSDDETAAVCAAHSQCRFFQREDYMQGNLNFAFDQATSDWILRIDSDERITPALANEIEDLLADPPAGVTGFEFWERPIILGRELRYGFGRKHFRKILFRRGEASYDVKHDHEDLSGAGRWLRGRNGYLHYNYAQVRQYLEKTNYYTDNDIKRALLPDRPPAIASAVRDSARAFYLYYLKWQGFRDGWVGFVDAAMRAFYPVVYWAKLRERWERERAASP
jgi:glycosyltransferase involved in cell wall biosynthesis